VGKQVEVTIVREGKKITQKVTIGELKEEKTYASTGEEKKEDVGMGVSELTPELARGYGITEKRGVVVTQVESGSPVEEAGIKEGDLIVEVNREPIKNLGEYNSATKKVKRGDKILLLITRENHSQFVVITLVK
jgi:serine protease Do